MTAPDPCPEKWVETPTEGPAYNEGTREAYRPLPCICGPRAAIEQDSPSGLRCGRLYPRIKGAAFVS